MQTHTYTLVCKWLSVFPYSMAPYSFLKPSIKMRQEEKVQFCAATEESLASLASLASLPSADPVIVWPPQGLNSCPTMWSPWQMRVGTRPDYSPGPLKWHSAISGDGWVLCEPEALLNHSAASEAGWEEIQTRTLSAPCNHLCSVSLMTERERESENQRERERAQEWKSRGGCWAEGQAILQRSQDAKGDLRQK